MFFVRRLRDLGCVLAVSGILCGRVCAQFSLPDANSARSVSGQFIVNRTAQFSPLANQPALANDPKLMRLDPALLAVSAERVKEALWRELDINLLAPWRGQIYLTVHPARTLDEDVTIVSMPAPDAWNYRVELPDVLPRVRFIRAMVSVLLREYAGRHATMNSHSIEIPAWLSDGLALQLLATGGRETVLSSPVKVVDGLLSSRTVTNESGMDPLADARDILQNHAALTFKQLSWPTDAQLSGADGGVYRGSAQTFTSELLKLKNGPAHLRVMLETLPDFYNWQTAFQNAFHENFPHPLDVEKWWSLQVVSMATHDDGPTWTAPVSCAKLAQIISVPVEMRTASNALPAHAEISLQAVINNWDAARQSEILQIKLRDLELAQLRMAAPLAALTAEYHQAIADYLGQTKPQTEVHHVVGKHPQTAPALPKKISPAETIKKLDALDEQRRKIESDIIKLKS